MLPGANRTCKAPTQLYRVGKKPSVKADLAIYSHIVDASGQCMSESFILGHKLVSVLVTFWSVFINPVTNRLSLKDKCNFFCEHTLELHIIAIV